MTTIATPPSVDRTAGLAALCIDAAISAVIQDAMCIHTFIRIMRTTGTKTKRARAVWEGRKSMYFEELVVVAAWLRIAPSELLRRSITLTGVAV
jgi:hypothetical protein